MKTKLILILTLFSLSAFAQEVQIHPEGFSNQPAGSGVHYSGRMMQWSVWETLPEHGDYAIPFNHIAAATTDSGEPSLTDDDFNLEGQTTTAMNLLKRYYNRRAPEHRLVQVQAEAVFTSKIQVDSPYQSYKDRLSLETFISSFVESDVPHSYTQVTKEWVHGFLPNHHLAKENLDDSSVYYLLTINAGGDSYNCSTLNSVLKYNDDAIKDRGGSAYLFMLVKFNEANPDSLAIESGAQRTFVQEIIYSTSFIRSGKNIISFYDDKIISQNAIAVTDVVMKLPETLANRLDLGTLEKVRAIKTALTGEAEQQFVLTSDNLEIIGADNSECGQGLGLGVASYTYNIANRLANGL